VLQRQLDILILVDSHPDVCYKNYLNNVSKTKMFNHDDYKAIIAEQLIAHKVQRGYRGKLAEAMGVHTSFLSQVMNSHVHITPDHAASLAEIWGLGEDESDFFITLVHRARSSSKPYQKFLQTKLDALRAKNKQISSRIASKALVKEDMEKMLAYYASWHLSATHVLLNVPGFDHAEAIAKRLGLSLAVVHHTLNQLELFGIVKKESGKYKVLVDAIHVPAKSPLVFQHHLNWRSYVMSRIAMRTEDTHYTSVMAVGRKDFEKIRETFLTAIEKTHKIAAPSPEEELFCLCFDAFEV
jgi:uncharacterized protein (TIGR02147 family)